MSRPNIRDAKCVLVIGATAGIGRALALAIHDLPSKPTVIVAGRRQERLDELTKTSDRIVGIRVDVTMDRAALKDFAESVVSQYPNLDAVLFSSGVQHVFKLDQPEHMNWNLFESELTTNYTSVVALINFFLPHLMELASTGHPTFLIPITSSLSVVPGQWVPYYSASKAALHSLCLSLVVQLKNTNVIVMEILPPLVESELHDHQGNRERLSKIWMPLDEFAKAAMEGLCRGDAEIPVGYCVSKWERHEKGKLEEMCKGPSSR
ncbi:hypothetical protein NM688_g2518 [Phlebia brevispora]|uniref:Uncharacterized protein n=1 Tax=Phlebia brevispora TaxID=194682 RepID=A0ACC1T8K5_9APHY|nr:hypothetical protein NM688_g2518 [Phlebia brevispora]